MNEQEKLCGRCGQAYIEGQNFCSNCGVKLRHQEQTESEQFEQIEVEQSVQEAPKKIKRNKYKARRFIALFFAIADIFLALPFLIYAVIFEKVSHLLYYDKSVYAVGSSEYKLSEISDIYYALAGAGYIISAFFAVGFVISFVMFFVYVHKRKKFTRSLELEAKETQGQIFEEAEEVLEEIEEIEEVTEEAEEQAKEKEPQMENQESQNQEQV